jgi:hypothetical protein
VGFFSMDHLPFEAMRDQSNAGIIKLYVILFCAGVELEHFTRVRKVKILKITVQKFKGTDI